MSSNLRIKKICQFCYSEFIAKTTVTKYCGLKCARKSYKQRKRDEKILLAEKKYLEKSSIKKKNKISKKSLELSNSSKAEITGEIKNDVTLEGEKKNDVITVREAAHLLGVTNKTVYNMIKSGRIEAYNINVRLIRVKRACVENLISFDLKNTSQSENFDIEDTYTISEISKKFNISTTYVYHTLKEYKVPKRNDGKFVKVPRNIVDLIFKNFI